jgi:hypothetical protein
MVPNVCGPSCFVVARFVIFMMWKPHKLGSLCGRYVSVHILGIFVVVKLFILLCAVLYDSFVLVSFCLFVTSILA